MIHLPTLFVVGAGGSMPFDFPSGPKMLAQARNASADGISRLVCHLQGIEAASRFRLALIDCMEGSLDSLLETRDDFDQIGRLYIARCILEAESAAINMWNRDGDWLAYLFQMATEGCRTFADFAAIPLRFATYNYDRLIEHRLSLALAARYRVNEAQLAEYWRQRPVIHLHGAAGSLDTNAVSHVPFGAGGGDFAERVPLVLEAAANKISIIHQADPNSGEFQQVRDLFAWAQTVVFLGFAFGRTNVERLNLRAIQQGTTILATTRGMAPGETERLVREPFRVSGHPAATIIPSGMDSLDALRYHSDLIARSG